jgi:hypothetical protein
VREPERCRLQQSNERNNTQKREREINGQMGESASERVEAFHQIVGKN